MKTKILFIEDDLILLNNVKDLLEEEGFEVKTESDGINGIKAFYEFNPDLIICDISIPGKDGYEVLIELSSEIRRRNIPFIFLTAKVEREDLRKGMSLGADDYIFKPFNVDDLLSSIKLRLNKASIRKNSLKEEKKNYQPDDKILFKTGIKAELIPVKEIKSISAESPYVLIKFSNGRSCLQRETLEHWEEKLPEKIFIRINRSTIINTDFISKIEKLGNTSYLIKLKDEIDPFIISRRFLPKFKSKFN
jgi:DNA-binding LytR/AlgR family response regulator